MGMLSRDGRWSEEDLGFYLSRSLNPSLFFICKIKTMSICHEALLSSSQGMFVEHLEVSGRWRLQSHHMGTPHPPTSWYWHLHLAVKSWGCSYPESGRPVTGAEALLCDFKI